jgi:dTDP-4-dehydrorhamnose reductase
LCHISTDYVFSGDADQPYREYDLPNPKSVYGKTKLSGEQYAAARCRRLFVVRTQWLYGYYGNNFVKTILRLAREKGHLSVVNDQFGCPTNAVDLAHHILKISAGNCYGVYHCANHGVASWYEFAQEIVRLSGIKASVTPCTTEEFPRPAPRPAYSPLDNMMLRLTVQDTMRSWQDALAVFMQNLEREMSKETK